MIAYILILIGALARFLPHPPNFTPITALALYSGVTLDKRAACFVPLAALFLSDLVVGFHPTMVHVYGSFLVIVALGFYLRTHLRLIRTVIVTLIGSTFFYVVTCYGAWRQGGVIGDTFWENLIISLPFFRNMLLGDLFYVGVLFGLHRAAQIFVSKITVPQKT